MAKPHQSPVAPGALATIWQFHWPNPGLMLFSDDPSYITGDFVYLDDGRNLVRGVFMDQIFIKDLLCRGVIGISENERSQPQDIVINIVLFADITTAGASDSIKDCVNYRTVAEQVLAHTEKIQRFTVEALATDISKLCLENPLVQKVRVRVEKPGAVRFTASVGVEIERSRL
jgi:dihydroneopterin aldolase